MQKGGLVALIFANLLVLLLVGLQIRAGYTRPEPLVIDTNKDLTEAFDAYKSRADNIQTLLTALVGLASLYAVTLGFTTYLNAQNYIKLLEDNLTASGKRLTEAEVANAAAKLQADRLRKEFPTFDHIAASIRKMIGQLRKLLPETEWIQQHYDQITADGHQEILFYEKSIAAFELLNPEIKDRQTLDVFVRLSRYYRAAYDHERRSFEKSGGRFPSRGPVKDWSPREQAIMASLDRAEFYARKSARSVNDFVCFNELAIIAYKRSGDKAVAQALLLFEQSIKYHPGQQRAHYWISILRHQLGEYGDAERSLMTALSNKNWERRVIPARKYDILYNLACARARLAKAETWNGRQVYAEAAITDLEKACPGPDQLSLSVFEGDRRVGQDLEILQEMFPDRMSAIRETLQGKGSSG